MYIAAGIIILVSSLLLVTGIIITLIRSSQNAGDLISKKNLLYLAPTFVIIYLLHLVAANYNSYQLDFFYCFSLINTVLNVLQFKAESAIIAPICEAYPIFYVDFALAFIVGGATVILSIASFFSRRMSNRARVNTALRNKCDMIIGDSEDAVEYVKNTKNSILLVSNVNNPRYTDLMKQSVPVLRLSFDVKILSRKLKRGGYNIIVFRDGSFSYTGIIETFMQLKCKEGIKIYLEANQQEMKIIKDKFITKADYNTDVFITGFSKYELMARRFVVDYPITKYIPRSFYNDNFTVKNDRQINIVFVGFGKVNYQLFRMCAMQFQFVQEVEGKFASKPVQYHIYDSLDASLHNEFFSRILYEFDETFSDCDFPKPEKICDLDICQIDVNSVEAKKRLKSFVTENSFTYFIISLKNDLEDASYAQTVKRLLRENDNYRIFVRAKNINGEKLNGLDDRVIYFGEEKKLYTHENIINDDLTELAQRINLLYHKISAPPKWLKALKEDKSLTAEEQGRIFNKNLANPESREYMLRKWAELPYIEQASNLYHALNLPFKLNLLGFDMVKKRLGDETGITEAQFNCRYKNTGRATGYDDYSFFFRNESSNVLAYCEHSRWNAMYILYDYKQMSKADMKVEESVDNDGHLIKNMPHKNIELKQHACVTAYYGLDELIRFKFKTFYPGEDFKNDDERALALANIYRYDYMDLDRLYGEITSMGYVLKTNTAES